MAGTPLAGAMATEPPSIDAIATQPLPVDDPSRERPLRAPGH